MTNEFQDKAQRTREGHLRANAEYQKVISLIFSLSTATIGLPLFFFKEIFGIKLDSGQSLLAVVSTAANIPFFITLLAAVALIAFSVKCGIDYIEHSGYYVRRILQMENILELKSKEIETIAKLNRYFSRSTYYFVLGFAFMIVSIVIFVKP